MNLNGKSKISTSDLNEDERMTSNGNIIAIANKDKSMNLTTWLTLIFFVLLDDVICYPLFLTDLLDDGKDENDCHQDYRFS